MQPNAGRAPAAHEHVPSDRTIVFLDGEIDMGSAGELASALRDAIRTPATEVVVDLGQVRFMDSSGLRLLVTHGSALARDGRRLIIRRARRPVRRLFEVAGDEHLLA